MLVLHRPVESAVAFCVLPNLAGARVITIEPDNYAQGTDLSSISPYVKLGTTDGSAVYAGPIDAELNPDLHSTGPLRNRVFSQSPDRNWEWMGSPFPFEYESSSFDRDEWANFSGMLLIEFLQPIDWFSLLLAELFHDAGCCFNDPVAMFLYNSVGDQIFRGYIDGPVDGYLGTELYGGTIPVDSYPYWTASFSYPDIRYVVVGGDSEPTTIDRLRFKITPVPEPGTLALLALGLVGMGYARRRNRTS